MPVIRESWNCCDSFADVYEKHTGHKYSKADPELYQRLSQNGDEEKAISIAQKKYDQCVINGYNTPSQMCPCTTVHELVGEIKSKIKETEGI